MYGPLASLVPRFGARRLLALRPGLLSDTVVAMREYGLCSAATGLLLALVRQLRLEWATPGALIKVECVSGISLGYLGCAYILWKMVFHRIESGIEG